MVDDYVELRTSPVVPAVSPVRIRCRDTGSGDGMPIVFLHGAWGYEIYPFDRQAAALQHHRIVIPDRTGYGASQPIDVQLPGFHQRAAEETLAMLDALAIPQAILWGHSDGAVTALRVGLTRPAAVAAIVSEASHYFRRKPASRAFFETMRDRPEDFGERIVSTLERDHGARWRRLISTNGAAWLAIAHEAESGTDDLYDGRLPALEVPTLLVHGGRDPRTEPGELEAMTQALDRRSAGVRARSRVLLLPDGAHSPHSERATADAVTQAALEFVQSAFQSAIRNPQSAMR